MEYESTKEILPFMTPFPDSKDVFAGDIAAHTRYLQPLLSIDLAAINPDWPGKVHFVTPKEPYEGLVGENTLEFHDYYNRENWIAFRVADDRYTFMGDFRYFFLESMQDEELEEHCREVDASLEKTRRFFQQHGMLNPWGQTDNPCEWFDGLGGAPGYGNWGETGDFPMDTEDDGDGYYNGWPLTEDGRRFFYIGCLPGYAYREGAADGILLFYDPVEKIALLTFDWS